MNFTTQKNRPLVSLGDWTDNSENKNIDDMDCDEIGRAMDRIRDGNSGFGWDDNQEGFDYDIKDNYNKSLEHLNNLLKAIEDGTVTTGQAHTGPKNGLFVDDHHYYQICEFFSLLNAYKNKNCTGDYN